MNNLIEETLDDGSIVVVSRQSIDEEMETESTFMITPRFLPGMTEQLSDSTHKQLQDMLKENNELRDSLHKNNTEMRQLLAAFRDYQEKTLQSRTLHKQKIDSIWKDSQQLQLEKTNISKENKDLQDQLKLRDLESEKLQKDLVGVQANCSDLENELASLKEDARRSEVMILTITSQMKEQETELAALKLEREKLFNQNEALIEQLEKQQSVAMSKLVLPDSDDMGFSLVNGPEDMTLQRKLENEETKVKEFQQIIVQQNDQIEKLQKSLSLTKDQASIQSAEIAERFFQIQKMSNLEPACSILQEYGERYQSIGQQLGACEKRLQYLKLEDSSSVFQEGLKREVAVLKQLLEQEREEKATEIRIMEERIEQVTQNYRQILASWEIYESDQNTKGRQSEALNAIEKRQHQEQLDELMAKNVSLEEESQARESDLARLKRQITMLNTETEQMPILRAQVEVYRQDFTKEREEKTKAETLANQLSQEVSSLQSQVSELRDELSALHDQQRRELSFNHSGSYRQLQDEGPPSPPTTIEDFVMPRGRQTTFKHADDDRESSRKRRGHQSRIFSPPSFQEQRGATSSKNSFECPRCKMTYSTVTDVENHLEACLSNGDLYP